MNQNSMLDETIEEFVCEIFGDGAGIDYDIFMVEEVRDMFIEFLVRNQDLISNVLYKDDESSGEEPN